MYIDTEKLEQLILTNWTSFINYRQLMELVEGIVTDKLQYSPCKVQQLKLSRFEYRINGFLLWIDYKLSNNKIGTIEAILQTTGLEFIKILELNNT